MNRKPRRVVATVKPLWTALDQARLLDRQARRLQVRDRERAPGLVEQLLKRHAFGTRASEQRAHRHLSGRLDGPGWIWPYVAMKRVKIAELKDHLSEHLRAVEGGVEMEVTDRNRPIVRLVPAAAAGATVIVPAQRPFKDIRGKRFRPTRWPVCSLDLLLEERGTR